MSFEVLTKFVPRICFDDLIANLINFFRTPSILNHIFLSLIIIWL